MGTHAASVTKSVVSNKPKSTSTIGIPMPTQDACAFLDADRKAEWLKHISLLYGVLPSD